MTIGAGPIHLGFSGASFLVTYVAGSSVRQATIAVTGQAAPEVVTLPAVVTDPAGMAGLCFTGSMLFYEDGGQLVGTYAPTEGHWDAIDRLFCDDVELYIQPIGGLLQRRVDYHYPGALRENFDFLPVVADTAGVNDSGTIDSFAAPGIGFKRTVIPAPLDPFDGVDRDCNGRDN